MTRAEYSALGKLSDAELSSLTAVELSALQATMTQRDAAEANKADAAKAAADALAAKEAEHAAALAKATADHAAAQAASEARINELSSYVDAVASEPKAIELARQKQKDDLNAKIARAEADKAAAAAELAALGVVTPVPTKYVEKGPPDDKIGNDGDTWTDTVSGNVYEKANGTWF